METPLYTALGETTKVAEIETLIVPELIETTKVAEIETLRVPELVETTKVVEIEPPRVLESVEPLRAPETVVLDVSTQEAIIKESIVEREQVIKKKAPAKERVVGIPEAQVGISKIDDEFKFAMGLFNDGVYKLARREFINFAQTYKESELVPDSKYFAAECLYRTYQYKDAIEEFKLIKRLYPKFSVDASLRIGLSYYEIGVIDSGITIFTEIKDKRPDEAYYWLGEGYFKLKEYAKAIEFYKLVKQGKYQEYALYSVGFASLELKNYEQSISYLKAVTEPDLLPQTEFLIAKAFYEKGDYEEAITRLKKISGKYEEQSNFLLGETFYNLSKFNEAIQFYSKCETVLGIAGLGKTYYALKDYPKALTVYEKLLNYPEYRNIAIESIGRIYYEQKHYNEAIKWFSQLTTYTAKLTAANAYFENGEYKEALSRYESLYKETQKPEPLYWMALSLYKLEKYKEAEKLLITYPEKDSRVSLLLGEIAYHNKSYEAALSNYEVASKCATTQMEAWKGMVASFLALKRPDAAYEVSKLLVEHYPNKDTYYQFANVAYINKKYDEAMHFCLLSGAPFENLLATENDPKVLAQARLEFGKLLSIQEKFESAIDEFNLVLESGFIELLPEARYELGEVYFKLKNYKEALTSYLKVKYLYSENKFITPVLYKSAKCEEALNEKEEAKKFYQMVIERGDVPDLTAKSKQALERLK